MKTCMVAEFIAVSARLQARKDPRKLIIAVSSIIAVIQNVLKWCRLKNDLYFIVVYICLTFRMVNGKEVLQAVAL